MSVTSLHERCFPVDCCTYCGASHARGLEQRHIFSPWLHERFPVQGSLIRSVSQAITPSRPLTAPCCQRCIADDSALDRLPLTLLLDRPPSAHRKHIDTIFNWACKILLGLTYLDRALPAGRLAGGKARRRRYRAFRLVQLIVRSLQARISFRHRGKPWTPGSIFLFDLHSPSSPADQFEVHYDPPVALSMRLGTRGIIVVVDGGALAEKFGEFFSRHAGRRLHPIQFQELGAVAFYRASLLQDPCRFSVRKDGSVKQVVERIDSDASRWGPWVQADFASVLAAFTGIAAELLNPDRSREVLTWMSDAEGAPLELDLDKLPFSR